MQAMETKVRFIWREDDLDADYFGVPRNLVKQVKDMLNGRGGMKHYQPQVRYLEASGQFEVEFTVGRDPAMAVIATASVVVLRRLAPFGVPVDKVWRIEALSEAV